MIKRWRIRLAHWLAPGLFKDIHDMCNNAVPLNSPDSHDKYHVKFVDEQAYIDAWIKVAPIAIHFSDEWEQ